MPELFHQVFEQGDFEFIARGQIRMAAFTEPGIRGAGITRVADELVTDDAERGQVAFVPPISPARIYWEGGMLRG